MRKSAFIIVAAMSAAALAACSPAAESDTGATTDAAATPATSDGPAPGLWRLTTTTSVPGAPAAPPVEVCVTSAQFDTGQAGGATAGGDCQTSALTREGDAMVSSATCTMPGGGTSTSEVRISGDFSSNYTMETTVRMDPAPTPQMAEMRTTTTAERVGDCPAA